MKEQGKYFLIYANSIFEINAPKFWLSVFLKSISNWKIPSNKFYCTTESWISADFLEIESVMSSLTSLQSCSGMAFKYWWFGGKLINSEWKEMNLEKERQMGGGGYISQRLFLLARLRNITLHKGHI